MNQTSLQDTLAELTELCQLFADAEAKLKDGQMADLTGVDARVAAVCKTVEDALPSQQQQYLPELTVLIGLLGSYEHALRDLHADIQNKATEGDNG